MSDVLNAQHHANVTASQRLFICKAILKLTAMLLTHHFLLSHCLNTAAVLYSPRTAF